MPDHVRHDDSVVARRQLSVNRSHHSPLTTLHSLLPHRACRTTNPQPCSNHETRSLWATVHAATRRSPPGRALLAVFNSDAGCASCSISVHLARCLRNPMSECLAPARFSACCFVSPASCCSLRPCPSRHSGVRSRNPVFALRPAAKLPKCAPPRLKSFLEKTLIAHARAVFAARPPSRIAPGRIAQLRQSRAKLLPLRSPSGPLAPWERVFRTKRPESASGSLAL